MAKTYEVIIRTSLQNKDLKAAEREASSSFDRMAAKAEQAAKRELAAVQRQTREAERDIRRYERERQQIAQASSRAIERQAKAEADMRIREGKRAANELIAQLRQVQQQQVTRSSGGNSFLAGAAGGLAALAGTAAVNQIRQGAAAWLDYSSNLESTKIAFTTMLGSAEAAQQHLNELQQFALKTPFEFSDLVDASQRMQALGFAAEQVIPILTDVGNAVAAAGGGKERLDRVVLALSQIQSKGKVATQELNQLAESGINGFKILEDQTGKSRAALVKMVEAGEISSKVFLDAFQKFSKQNFGGLMEQQSKTFTGAMSNIKDALLQTSATAFAPLYQRLSELAQQFGEAATKSKEFREEMNTLGEVVATLPDAFIEIYHLLKDIVTLISAIALTAFGTLTHAIFAMANALRSALDVLDAWSKFIRGDFVGANQALERAVQQEKRAVDELSEAYGASGAAATVAAQIYEAASNRTMAAAMRMATAGVMINANAANMLGVDAGKGAIGAGIFRPKGLNFPTGTDGGSGSKTAKISAGQQLLNQLTEEYNRLQVKTEGLTRLQAIQTELLADKYKKLTPELRQQIEEMATYITMDTQAAEAAKKKAAAVEEVDKFITKQTEAIIAAQDNSREWNKEIRALTASLMAAGQGIDEKRLKTIKDNDATLKAIELSKEWSKVGKDLGSGLLDDAAELNGKTASDMASILDDLNEKLLKRQDLTQVQITLDRLEKEGLLDLNDANVQRVLAVAEQIDQQSQLLKLRENVRDAAQDIASIFADATEDWSGSIGGFFRSIASGFGDMVRRMIASTVYSGVTNVMQNLLGRIFGVGGGQQSGGGILGSLTGGFAGGPGGAGLLSGLAGGFAAPPSLSAAGGSIPFGNAALAALLKGGGTTGTAASGGLLSGLGGLGGLAGILPMLGVGAGLGLGSAAGGQSGLGRILGGIGGAGLGGALGLLGFTALGGTFSSPALVAALGILGPAALIAGPLLIAGAIILKKNKERQLAEQVRNTAGIDTRTAIYQLLAEATSGKVGLSGARTQFEEIHQNYLRNISGIKDDKTKRNALLWWDHVAGIQKDPGGATQPLWPLIEAAAIAGEKRQNDFKRMTPVFARGGINQMNQLIRVSRGEGFRAPGSSMVSVIPGRFEGKEDTEFMFAPRGAEIIPRSRMQGTSGFANGTGGGEFAPQINVEVNIQKDWIAEVVVTSPLFKKQTIRNVKLGRLENKI